jgi:hypothetical protein
MASEPISEEIADALSRFFVNGAGPSHYQITEVFTRAELIAFDPAGEVEGPIGKEKRVRAVLLEAAQHPSDRGSTCVRALIARLRSRGSFDAKSDAYAGDEIIAGAQRAFAIEGWTLAGDGQLSPTVLSLVQSAHIRPAIEAVIKRVGRGAEDPALLIGTAKELLETVSRYVVEELDEDVRAKADFEELVFSALRHLGLVPEHVTATDDATRALQEIYGGLWKAARAVNFLRNIEGTGHGRTKLPRTSVIAARAVVQSSGILAQMMITTLDDLHA